MPEEQNDNLVAGTKVDHLEFFEIVGDLYYRRYRRLRPGKSEPMGMESSCSDDNQKQFSQWCDSLQCYRDAIQEISRLKSEINRAYQELQKVDDILYSLKD